MTVPAFQALESARLAQYASPLSCYLCDTENSTEAERCTRCQAPLALAHQVDPQRTPPDIVAAIGPSGAGKTVYLGMLLELLSHPSQPLGLLARGAFSVTLQQATVGAMAACRFPEKTPNEPERWNWVHCQVRQSQRKRPRELVLLDMAGEALLDEIDHPHSAPAIGALLRKCSAVLLLVDVLRLRDGAREEDCFAMKLLSHLSEVSPSHGAGRPLAVVFTKADQCDECREDPVAFARAHAPGLWQHCQERFPRHRFFASGVAGTCAVFESPREGHFVAPLRIEPHGIVEPFVWLLEQFP